MTDLTLTGRQRNAILAAAALLRPGDSRDAFLSTIERALASGRDGSGRAAVTDADIAAALERAIGVQPVCETLSTLISVSTGKAVKSVTEHAGDVIETGTVDQI